MALGATLLALTAGCGPSAPDLAEQGTGYLIEWFEQAVSGARDESLCHGMGLLKHQEFTCADMLAHAAKIDPASRAVVSTTPRECFATVCGEFLEVELNSRDPAGNEVRETAVLKRDNQTMRVYWYRSDTLLEAYRRANPAPDPEDDKDPLQQAYAEVTALYPALFSFPPCYRVRVSSTNLAGELMPATAMDVAAVEAAAEACGDTFCFGLVGAKIAPVCPAASGR